MEVRGWRMIAAASACLLAAATGCSGSGAGDDTGATLRLANFHIEAPDVLPAGENHLVVRNAGPTMHELVIVRTSRAATALPLDQRGDVEEDASVLEGHGEVEGLDMNERATLDVALEPGHYVLFCNMDGHYVAGMHTDLTVRP